MKATYSHNGKKFIYKVDGKQVRTSQKANPYQFVAIKLVDGQFSQAIALGLLKTCESEVSKYMDSFRRCKVVLQYFKGEITYKEYVTAVGWNNAMTKSYMEKEKENNAEYHIKWNEECIERASHDSYKVLPFEQE